MFGKILDKLSGSHITAIAITAMVVPGAAVAAVAYQAVAIVDPNTGSRSYVDSGRRLSVYDPIAGYGNAPWNKVEIKISNSGNLCETNYEYKVPTGRALIITAVSGYETQYSTSVNFSGYHLYDNTGCSGNFLSAHISPVTSSSQRVPLAVELGSGVVVRPGKTVSVYSVNNYGFTFLHGYLVPASSIPAAAAAGAAGEPRSISAAEVAAKAAKFGSR